MSGEKTEQPKPTTEELIAQLIKGQEETKKNIDMLAQAIVEVNKKVEAKAPQGNPSGDPLATLASLLAPKGGTIEDVAKSAENLAKLGESLDRFRTRGLGLGDALLMRLGMRAAFPRYMTKAELQRAEKMLGIFEAIEGEETEHVT